MLSIPIIFFISTLTRLYYKNITILKVLNLINKLAYLKKFFLNIIFFFFYFCFKKTKFFISETVIDVKKLSFYYFSNVIKIIVTILSIDHRVH